MKNLFKVFTSTPEDTQAQETKTEGQLIVFDEDFLNIDAVKERNLVKLDELNQLLKSVEEAPSLCISLSVNYSRSKEIIISSEETKKQIALQF